MSAPMSAALASLVLSEKANQLGHDSIGTWGRRLTSALLILSAILGYLAGVTGLTGLVGKTAVAVLGIAAGVTTTSAILALTMLKSGEHLRIAGEYELLFLKTVRFDEGLPEISSVTRNSGNHSIELSRNPALQGFLSPMAKLPGTKGRPERYWYWRPGRLMP